MFYKYETISEKYDILGVYKTNMELYELNFLRS